MNLYNRNIMKRKIYFDNRGKILRKREYLNDRGELHDPPSLHRNKAMPALTNRMVKL